jgi:hypothetical protein
MNYLGHGFYSLGWSVSTIQNYRSHILKMYDDPSPIATDPNYQTFMKAISATGVKRLHNIDVDISPVFRHLTDLGDNSTMGILDLTRKLCWLLGTCGFLRPDDIRCLDASASTITNGDLNAVIVFPKERRGGQRIIKSIRISQHVIPAFCPVRAFNAYRIRTCPFDKRMPHPKDDNETFLPLIRNCGDLSLPITTERISKHIDSINRLLPGYDNGHRLKARAIGATLALKKGISVDDVTVQGNWSSAGIVNEFYRLSRSTAHNLTDAVLDSSGVTSIVSSSG